VLGNIIIIIIIIIKFELCSHADSAYDELSTCYSHTRVLSLVAMVSLFGVSLRK